MLVPARRVLQGLNYEFAKLQTFFADSNVEGSAALSITASLQTLLNREMGGAAAIYAQVDRLDTVLNEVSGLLGASASDVSADISAIRTQLASLKSVNVVADLEPQVRRILDYLGLSFEAGCVEFYRNDRAVRTPSSEQVRQPIFTDGLDQWENFEPYLDPLRAVLGPELSS